MVVDKLAISDHVVVVYNTDVAVSNTIADFYCSKRGIPTANKIGFAMGTRADYWSYSADAFADFYTPLYNKVIEVGAQAVFLSAGCPRYIQCHRFLTPFTNDGYWDLAFACARVKDIYPSGVAPKSYDTGGTSTWKALKGTQPDSVWPPNLSQYLQQVLSTTAAGYTSTEQFTTYETAVSGNGSYPSITFVKPAANFDRDYSRFLKILPGRIGYHSFTDTASYDANLENLSKACINRGQGTELTLAQLKTRPFVVGIGILTNTATHPAAFWAAFAKWLEDEGFTDVTSFYHSTATGDTVATGLVPVTLETSDFDTDFTGAPIPMHLGIGPAWLNGRSETTDSPTWRNVGGDRWFSPDYAGILIGGQSNIRHWVPALQRDGFLGGAGQIAHQTAPVARSYWPIFRRLYEGYTLAEACWWANGGGTGGSSDDQSGDGFFAAYGDPLWRMVIDA